MLQRLCVGRECDAKDTCYNYTSICLRNLWRPLLKGESSPKRASARHPSTVTEVFFFTPPPLQLRNSSLQSRIFIHNILIALLPFAWSEEHIISSCSHNRRPLVACCHRLSSSSFPCGLSHEEYMRFWSHASTPPSPNASNPNLPTRSGLDLLFRSLLVATSYNRPLRALSRAAEVCGRGWSMALEYLELRLLLPTCKIIVPRSYLTCYCLQRWLMKLIMQVIQSRYARWRWNATVRKEIPERNFYAHWTRNWNNRSDLTSSAYEWVELSTDGCKSVGCAGYWTCRLDWYDDGYICNGSW